MFIDEEYTCENTDEYMNILKITIEAGLTDAIKDYEDTINEE